MKNASTISGMVFLTFSLLMGCSQQRDEETPKDGRIYIFIAQDGEYRVQGKKCDVASLEERLRKLRGDNYDSTIDIICPESTPFRLVQNIVEPASRLPIYYFWLRTGPGVQPTKFTRECAGPWHLPELHIRVFRDRFTINGSDAPIGTLNARLQKMSEETEHVAFVMPQTDATVGGVYSAFRICEDKFNNYGLLEEGEQVGGCDGEKPRS